MLSAKLIELIETHADALTQSTLKDLATNPHTPSFKHVPADELRARVYKTFHNLGRWIGDPSDDTVPADFESWGAKRVSQGVPLSEIVYAFLLVKHHLRQYVRDHGLVETSIERAASRDMIGLQLHGIQELNYKVGEFFDRAIYHLARGYEAGTKQGASGPPR